MSHSASVAQMGTVPRSRSGSSMRGAGTPSAGGMRAYTTIPDTRSSTYLTRYAMHSLLAAARLDTSAFTSAIAVSSGPGWYLRSGAAMAHNVVERRKVTCTQRLFLGLVAHPANRKANAWTEVVVRVQSGNLHAMPIAHELAQRFDEQQRALGVGANGHVRGRFLVGIVLWRSPCEGHDDLRREPEDAHCPVRMVRQLRGWHDADDGMNVLLRPTGDLACCTVRCLSLFLFCRCCRF